MKLNNRGWGLQAMMICVLVLMIALVIIAVLVKQLGATLGIEKKPIDKAPNEIQESYKDLENKAIIGAKKYHDKYYSDMQDKEKVTVTLKSLSNYNMIDDIFDLKDNQKCSGYVVFTLENKEVLYYAYLNCSNYMTKGYLSQLDV